MVMGVMNFGTGAQSLASPSLASWAAAVAAALDGSDVGVNVRIADAAAPDASPTVKGIVKLAGDLGGTAALPTVPGLALAAQKSANLSDLASVATARTNLGLGTAATTASTAYATAAQGTLAGTASQPGHAHAGADITSGTVAYARLPVGTAASTVAAGDDARFMDPQYAVNVVATSGAAQTLPATVAAHKVTLSVNCTFFFTAPTKVGHTFLVHVSGAFTVTWPASVKWDSGTAPTYATPSVYSFTTFDTGTTWLGSQVAKAIA